MQRTFGDLGDWEAACSLADNEGYKKPCWTLPCNSYRGQTPHGCDNSGDLRNIISILPPPRRRRSPQGLFPLPTIPTGRNYSGVGYLIRPKPNSKHADLPKQTDGPLPLARPSASGDGRGVRHRIRSYPDDRHFSQQFHRRFALFAGGAGRDGGPVAD